MSEMGFCIDTVETINRADFLEQRPEVLATYAEIIQRMATLRMNQAAYRGASSTVSGQALAVAAELIGMAAKEENFKKSHALVAHALQLMSAVRDQSQKRSAAGKKGRKA